MSESFAVILMVFYMRHCSLNILYVDDNSHISFFMAGTNPITFIEGGQAFKLACHDGVTSVEHQPEICSSHEETDVRIIIYIKYIQTTMSHIKKTSGSEQRTLTSSLYFSILPNRSRSTFLWIQERS